MDMNKIKNHPGFMPFGHKNVGVQPNTQVADDRQRDKEEATADSKLK